MQQLSISAVRADALFVSALQCSADPTAAQVQQAVTGAVRNFGSRGCAARVAQEYGDHPEPAAARMRWAHEVTNTVYGPGAQHHRARRAGSAQPARAA